MRTFATQTEATKPDALLLYITARPTTRLTCINSSKSRRSRMHPSLNSRNEMAVNATGQGRMDNLPKAHS